MKWISLFELRLPDKGLLLHFEKELYKMQAQAGALVKRRRSYSVDEKLRYLRDLEDALANQIVRNGAEFAAHHRIPYETFRKWDVDELQVAAADQYGKSRKIRLKEQNFGTWNEVENELHAWFLGMRDKRLPVSVESLQEKAAELFRLWWDNLDDETRNEETLTKPIRHEFRASNGWVWNFMKRKDITLRKGNKNTKTIPADAAQSVAVFRDGVLETIEQFDIHFNFFFNMDQTFLLLDCHPLYTCETKGSRSVDMRTSRANTKLGCTVSLCISATGTKLPAHVTFPRRGFVRQLQNLNVNNIPANVKVTSSESGWFRQDTIEHWVEEVLAPHLTAENCEQYLLIVDRYRVHRGEVFGTAIMALGGIIDFVPAGCTSIAQPLDVTVMRSFKCHARRQWKTWKTDNTNEEGQCDPITLLDVVNIVSRAWEAIPNDVVVSGFETAFRPQQAAGAGPLLPELEQGVDEENEDGVDFIDMDNELAEQ